MSNHAAGDSGEQLGGGRERQVPGRLREAKAIVEGASPSISKRVIVTMN